MSRRLGPSILQSALGVRSLACPQVFASLVFGESAGNQKRSLRENKQFAKHPGCCRVSGTNPQMSFRWGSTIKLGDCAIRSQSICIKIPVHVGLALGSRHEDTSAGTTDDDPTRASICERLRSTAYLPHSHPQFMFGRGYGGPLNAPKVLWRSDQPPRSGRPHDTDRFGR